MAEPSGSPIIILSEDDDDDDDVVVIKMEKIPVEDDDDDDVVFISHTPATTKTPCHVQLSNPAQPAAGNDLAPSSSSTSICQPAGKVSSAGFKHGESISGESISGKTISIVLGQTVRANSLDHCPLDLSRHCGQSVNCKHDDSSVLISSKVKPDDSAMEMLSSVSVEAESSSMDYKEMDTDAIPGVGVTSTSDMCGSYLGDSSLSPGVVTDAGPGSPDVSSVIVPVTNLSGIDTGLPMSVKSSDLQSPVQSPKSGHLVAGGSVDEIHSMPNFLDSSNDTSVDSKTKLIGFNQEKNTNCQNNQSTSAVKVEGDLLLNFNNTSASLPVDIGSSTVSNPPANCVVKGLAVSLDSSGPSNPLNIQKSANLPDDICDQSSVLHPQTKHMATVQSLVLDSMINLISTQKMSPSKFPPIQTNTASAADPNQSNAACKPPVLNNVNASAGSASRIAQCNLPPRKRVRVNMDDEDGYVKVPRQLIKPVELCVLCKLTLIDLKVSRCTQGHPACGVCLEGQVKLILTDKQGSLECIKDMCSSYYPMSELKHALPSLVVDILEDKLHKDYINFISDMMLTNASPPVPSDANNFNLVSSTSVMSVDHNKDANTDQSLSDNALTELLDIANDLPMEESVASKNNDLPSHWFPMDKKTNLLIVELQPESEEYVDIAIQFYKTMTFPTVADIAKIYRVQNPILWKYYCLKKMEMIHENDCHEIDVRPLFHGTNSSIIEAICRKGFDWRVCGKHGCVYGQGCYFARAASYSHQYTDKIKNSSRSRLTSLSSRINKLHAMILQTKHTSVTSNQPILPKPSPIGPFGATLPPPAHMQFSSQNAPQTSQLFLPRNISFGRQVYGPPFGSGTAGMNAGHNQNSQTGSALNRFTSASIFSQVEQAAKVLNSSVPYSLARSNVKSCPRLTGNNEMSQFPASSTIPNLSTSVAHQCLSELELQKSEIVHNDRIVSMSEIVASPTRKLFLASVLVGKYTGGNSSLRKPPPFYPISEPYGKCYDSCVDDIFDPKIVVIFDTNQAYPEYIVEYNFSGDS